MQFRILGPLEVVDGEQPIVLRKGKECALLAYLVLHANEVIPSERLIDELWGERPPPTAPKILQNAVSHLRKALGDGRLLTKGHGYELRAAPEEVDLRQFRRLAEEGRAIGDAAKLREALALWRGPALVDVRDETFAQHASLHLEEERLGVLEDRIAADLAEGRGAELVSELERLVREHPLRERLHGQLMLALYRAGRQADALEAYQRARRTLMDELGLEPSPRLQELELGILNQDPELEAPPRAPRPRETGSSPTGRRRRAALALVAVAFVAGGVVGIVYALDAGSGSPLVAKPNSLAVVDPSRNRLVAVVPVGTTPRGVARGRQRLGRELRRRNRVGGRSAHPRGRPDGRHRRSGDRYRHGCRRRVGGDRKRQHARPDAPANRSRPRDAAAPPGEGPSDDRACRRRRGRRRLGRIGRPAAQDRPCLGHDRRRSRPTWLRPRSDRHRRRPRSGVDS